MEKRVGWRDLNAVRTRSIVLKQPQRKRSRERMTDPLLAQMPFRREILVPFLTTYQILFLKKCRHRVKKGKVEKKDKSNEKKESKPRKTRTPRTPKTTLERRPMGTPRPPRTTRKTVEKKKTEPLVLVHPNDLRAEKTSAGKSQKDASSSKKHESGKEKEVGESRRTVLQERHQFPNCSQSRHRRKNANIFSKIL